MTDFEALLGKVAGGQDLSADEAQGAIEQLIEGGLPDPQVGLFLSALAFKGEAVAEVVGAARALRRHMTPIRASRPGLLDTCGTGGDASGTFNISTASALVIAAAGVPVAKHGNRRVTSRSGSADVLAVLGVNVEASVSVVEHALDELGICFCFAPLLHGALANVARVRRSLEMPTIFNLLGPLANPAGAAYQLLGVGKPGLRGLMADALGELGTEHALVVTGRDGLDEVTVAEATDVFEVSAGPSQPQVWTPEGFGVARSSLTGVRIDDPNQEASGRTAPEQSAAIIGRVLAGERGTARDLVVINAAAGLLAAQAEVDPRAAAERAAEAIDSGAARELLAQLVRVTNG
ncbi:MAG: anthranilate phosphoribosyltransferase [Pirellulales bacterium]|nr:anthranilate phosphoribosyltransferase [Pirellulales bacterium]